MIEHFLPFGRHKGQPPASVPTDYLEWLLRTCKLSSGLRAAVRAELVRRGVNPSQLPPEPPAKAPPSCRRCRGREPSLSWQELGGGRRAIRANCQWCGRFVTFVAQTPGNVVRADTMTLSPAATPTASQGGPDGTGAGTGPSGQPGAADAIVGDLKTWYHFSRRGPAAVVVSQPRRENPCEGVYDMTIDQAIRALTEARDKVGGDAPLLMADGLHVVKFPVGDACAYVCDLPQPEEAPEGEAVVA
jgi:hypothetical protein